MTLEPLFTIHVAVQAHHSTGHTPTGELRVVAFDGGSFEGQDLHGTLLPGGSDWQTVRADGALEIRARYMLRTDQGETIQVTSEGLRTGPPEVLAKLAAGDDVPADRYYFRTFIRLATAAPRLLHLNDRLYIGVGERRAGQVRIGVHAVP